MRAEDFALPPPRPTAYDRLRGEPVAPEGSVVVARDVVIADALFDGAVWGVRYDAADHASKLLVILDAETGEIVFPASSR